MNATNILTLLLRIVIPAIIIFVVSEFEVSRRKWALKKCGRVVTTESAGIAAESGGFVTASHVDFVAGSGTNCNRARQLERFTVTKGVRHRCGTSCGR